MRWPLPSAIFLLATGFACAGSEQEWRNAPAGPPPSHLCGSPALADRIESVTDRGEVKLASGRLVRFAGVRRPDDPVHVARGLAWLRSHQGSAVEIAPVRTEPDRWERLAAIMTVASEAGPIDLGRSLVAAGLALVDAGEEDALCQPELLATEQRAREGGLGLWGDERYTPVSGSDLDRLVALIGRFAVVERRIRSVGERPQRTYLNFGANWSKSLTITIPKRTWRRMLDRGLSAANLRGRRVRARGIVEHWSGPTITITAPELLENLDEGAPGGR